MTITFHRKNGIMLISVLWVLAILSLLALMLSRSVTVEQSFLNYSLGRMHSTAAARAGTAYAVALSEHRELMKHKSADELFKHYPVGNMAYVDIVGGITDEESKFNLNDIHSITDGQVFVNLLMQIDVPKRHAEEIVAAIIDWMDADDISSTDPIAQSPIGAENTYYQSLAIPYKTKNRPFNCTEELLMVKGVTLEIYDKLKVFITVLPKSQTSGAVRINLLTASEQLFQAYVREPLVISAKESLSKDLAAIEAYRRNPDKVDFDNLQIDEANRPLLTLGAYFHLRAVGVDKQRGVRTIIESVWNKVESTGQMALISWRKL